MAQALLGLGRRESSGSPEVARPSALGMAPQATYTAVPTAAGGGSGDGDLFQIEDLPATPQEKPLAAEDPAVGREGTVTPLPKSQMVCVVFLQLSEALGINVLFPFMAFMVEDFGYTGAKLGLYTGLLASAFCAAQFCSSVPWGMVSDRVGRKPCLVAGLFGSGLMFFVFGTSTTFTQAILARLATGLLNGNIGIMKSFLGQITDSTNRSAGFSYMAIAWGAGVCVAPILGGMLSKPAETWPGTFEGTLFDRFPYLLPCAIVGCYSLLAAVLIVVLLKEPERAAPRKAKHYEKVSTAEVSSVPEDDMVEDEKFVLFNPTVLRACLSYGLLAIVQQMADEALPLFMKLNRDRGGLGFIELNIGEVLAVGGVATLIVSVFIVPPTERRIGALSIYRIGLMGCLPLFSLLWVVGVVWPLVPTWVGWAVMMLCICCKNTCFSFAFCGAMVMISNSADAANLGSVNGLGQTFASFARAAGPTICGALWSLSMRLRFTPLAFLVTGFVCAIALLLSLWLPQSLRYAYGKAPTEEHPRVVLMSNRPKQLVGNTGTATGAAGRPGDGDNSKDFGRSLDVVVDQAQESIGAVELV